tara:strand:- start:2950 stop:3867 length:918 start_codon:yes stop_codon:yes gene_type:complete
MAKKPLTKEEQLALDLRRYESIISNPVFRNRGNARRIDMQPQNAAAVAQMIQNNPSLNPGGMLSTTTNNTPGLISDANAGSSMPVMQSDMQTNTQIPTQQTTSSNIFGDVLGTVFPGIDQSNKQLINAAILQGSLELLKPRQPGEGLAGQFGRAITAGQKVGTDLQKQELENLVAGVGLQKTAAEIEKLQKETKIGKPIKQSKEQSRIFKDSIKGLKDINKDFAEDINTIAGKSSTFFNVEEIDDLIALEAIALVNRGDYTDPVTALRAAAKRLATGELSINNQKQESVQSGVDRFANKNIKIKQ